MASDIHLAAIAEKANHQIIPNIHCEGHRKRLVIRENTRVHLARRTLLLTARAWCMHLAAQQMSRTGDRQIGVKHCLISGDEPHGLWEQNKE